MLALVTGGDAWAADQAVGELAAELRRDGAPVEVWRVNGADVNPAVLAERLATEPLFGGGTLAVIDDPATLLRSAAGRAAVDAAMDRIAPGNGLVVVALDDASGRRPATADQLAKAVGQRSGRLLSFPAPTRERMQVFITQRAAALGVDLEPAAARLLGERVGGWVRESDVDRRHQAQMAVGELEKLALYRPGVRIGVDDVRSLVPEAIPGSVWAFLDAVAGRHAAEATTLLGRILAAGTPPLPVLVAQLHRRLRSLIEAADQLAAGEPPSALPRLLKIKSYPAQKLAEASRAWSLDELEAALEGLFELDVTSKGLEGVSASEAEVGLAMELWLYERVRRA
jgi:DNA polymerase III delta subunit